MRKLTLPCRWGLLLFFFVTLTACHNFGNRGVPPQRLLVDQSNFALAQANTVIQGFHQLPFDRMLIRDARSTYRHDALLPVMLIDGFRTYAKGFEVESSVIIRSLRLKSFAWRRRRFGRTQNSAILFPSVLLLSERYQILADFKRPQFYLDSQPGTRDAMVASMNVPAVASRARYIVIYVSPENRIGSFQYCRGGQGMVRFGETKIPQFKGLPCFSLPFNMEGRVELLVR